MGRQVKERLGEIQGTSGGTVRICHFSSMSALGSLSWLLMGWEQTVKGRLSTNAVMEVRVRRAGALSQLRCLRPASCSRHTQYIYSFIIYLTYWNECSLRIETAFFFFLISWRLITIL